MDAADFGEGDLEMFGYQKSGEAGGFEENRYFGAKRIIWNKKYCSLLTSVKLF